MPRYASVDRQREEEDRHRSEILEAAARVLVEKGIHAATIRDVAKEARFSVGKLYLHFPNKGVLFQELLDHYIDRAVEIVEGAFLAPGPIAERFEQAVRDTLAFCFDNPLFLRLFVNETLGFELRLESQFGRSIEAKYQRMVLAAMRVAEEGVRTGELAGGSAGELAIKLAGIFNAVLRAELARPEPRPADEVAAVVMRLFWEGSRGCPTGRTKRR